MTDGKKRYRVRYGFEDEGSETASLKAIARQLLDQAVAMRNSPNDDLKRKGGEILDRIADAMVTAEESRLRNLFTALRPRPGGESEVKKRIQNRMRYSKREGATFHEFLQGWLNQPFDNLVLSRKGTAKKVAQQHYVVFDEDTCEEHAFKHSTFQKTYWPNCDK